MRYSAQAMPSPPSVSSGGGFQTSAFLPETHDFVVWFGKNKESLKIQKAFCAANRQEAFPRSKLVFG